MSKSESIESSAPKLQSPEWIRPALIDQEADSPVESSPLEQRAERLGAYVIAIATQKGGVAKTTTAASLGGAFVQLGWKVLLIDLDAQANLTLALGEDPFRVRGTITDVLFNSEPLLWKSHETCIPGLDLVPANSGMELAEHFLKSRINYETVLRDAINQSIRRLPLKRAQTRKAKNLSSLKTRSAKKNSSPPQDNMPQFDIKQLEETHTTIEYDVVILDCPPALGAVTLNAMVAADLLIIPMQPEYFSVHSLKIILPAIRYVRDKYNPKLAYRILITLFDRRNRIHQNFTRQLRQTGGSGVLKTIIEIDTKLRESALDGMPITELWKQSRSAVQYCALAEELIRFVEQAF
jgi:chromosome partitioning protein